MDMDPADIMKMDDPRTTRSNTPKVPSFFKLFLEASGDSSTQTVVKLTLCRIFTANDYSSSSRATFLALPLPPSPLQEP